MKIVHLAPVLLVSFILAACGGGGGGSSTPAPVDPDPTDPVDPTPPGLSQTEIDEEAMLVAGALGDNANVRTTTPTDATDMMGVVTTGMTPTSFMEDEDASPIALGGNWVSNAYTQTNQAGNVTLEGVLYNNVEDPAPASYAAYFGTDGDGLALSYVSSVAVGETDNGQVTFTASNTTGFSVGDNSDQFMFSGFSADPGTNFDLPGVNDPTTPGVDNERVGSFFGIEGKFTCSGTADAGCNARVSNSGVLTLLGDWLFTPDGFVAGGPATDTAAATGTMVQGVVPDSDYMVFGYWLEKTTARDGTVSYKVNLYENGPQSHGAVGHLEGTAKYAGPATGLYMKKTVDPNGMPISPFSSGQFSANAMLTANFGVQVSGSEADVVSGTISGFVDANGDPIADWTLMLGQSGDATDGEFSGTTTGYKGGTPGNWAGTFYGESDASDATAHPGSAAGTFNGHFTNGHVAGAFGTTLQKE